MPHIHVGHGHHDLTVGGFIFREVEGQLKVYLHKHKKYKMYLHFGGHVELDESIWAATLREIEEETGFTSNQLKVLQPKNYVDLDSTKDNAVLQPVPAVVDNHSVTDDCSHFHIDLKFAFIVNEDPEKELGDDESDDIKLLTLDEIQRLIEDEKAYSFILDSIKYTVNNLFPNWAKIPVDEFDTKSSLML